MRWIWTAFLIASSCAYGQSTVTLGGTQYTLKSHPRVLLDGAGGVLDSRVKDPDGSGPLKSPKAVSANAAWTALSTAVSGALPVYNLESSRYPLRDGVVAAQFASYWYADNSQTAARTAALYMLNHVEYYLPLVCVESTVDCVQGVTGYAITSYGISYWVPNWILAYELMRGEMTPAERQTFAAKMLNDRAEWGGIDGAAGTSCTNPTTAAGANVTVGNPVWAVSDGSLVSFTVSNGVATIKLNGSTAGIQVGEKVRVRSAPVWDNFLDVLGIDSPTQFRVGYTGQANGNYTAAGMTVTYMKPYATVSAPVFGAAVKAGDWLFTRSNSYNLGIVAMIVDSTHAYLEGDMQPAAADTLYYRAKEWSAGQCGVVWHVKHDEWTTPAITNHGASTLYPPSGGVNGADGGHNLVYSALWGLHLIFLSLVDDDVNAAVRSKAELAAVYDAWYTGPYVLAKRFWTGFHQSGSGYGIARAHQFMPGTAMAIQGSLVNGPNLMSGLWAKKVMVLDYANAFPSSQRAQMQWGQPDVSGGFGGMTAANLIGFTMLSYWFRNDAEGAYANWWLRNLWAGPVGFGNVPGTNLGFVAGNIRNSAPAWFFVYTDPGYPMTSLEGSPTTFLMNQSDTGMPGERADALISRTGFGSVNDTLLNFHAQTLPEFDHNVFANQPSNYGSYKIFKGHYLLAEDYGLDFNDPAANGFTIGGTGSNYVEIGGTDANLNIAAFPIEAGIPRSAGDASYAYGMADVTNAYKLSVGVHHAYRHLVDFKEAGTQQFIVDYVDFRTKTGKTKKAYYHYPNKTSTTLSGKVLTSLNTNGNASALMTQVVAPQSALVASNLGGGSFQLEVCPSTNATTCDAANTQAEMMVVHMPVAGTNAALPEIQTVSTTDTHVTGVQIGGASPKIAVFARDGGTFTTTDFTASHSGTAQILITGITPTVASGNEYAVLRDGVAVLRRRFVEADGTIYLKGPAGLYRVVPELPRPIMRFAPFADAVQFEPYTALAGVTGGTAPLSWSIGAGSAPEGMTLDPLTGFITGRAAYAGTSTFSLTVTDSLGQSDTKEFAIDVTPGRPLEVQSSLLMIKTGVPYSQTLAAVGGAGPYLWSVKTGTLPQGFTLRTDGLLTGYSVNVSRTTVEIEAADQYGNRASRPLELRLTLVPATNISGSVRISGRSMFQ